MDEVIFIYSALEDTKHNVFIVQVLKAIYNVYIQNRISKSLFDQVN